MPRKTRLHNLSNIALTTKEGHIISPKTVSRRLITSEIERILTVNGLSWEITKGEYYTTGSGGDDGDGGDGGSTSSDVYVTETIVEDNKKYLVLSNNQKVFIGDALYDTQENLIN